jgi:hypothetical protein
MDEESKRKMASSNRQAMESRAKKMLDKERPQTQKDIDVNNKKFSKFNDAGTFNVSKGK